jgi:hypothetical protein
VSRLLFQDLVREVERIRDQEWVDVEERLAFQRLLVRYDGASLPELRSAIAAVFARNAREADEIAAAFDALYASSPNLATGPDALAAPISNEDERRADESKPSSQPLPRAKRSTAAWFGWAAVSLVFVGIAWSTTSIQRLVDGGSLAATPVTPTASASVIPVEPTLKPPIPHPADAKPPPPKYWPPRAGVIALASLAGAIGLAFLGFRAARRRRATWHEQRWEDFSRLDGQRSYRVSQAPGRRRGTFTLEQLTVTLETVAGRLLQGSRLDVDETVRRTAATACVSLAFERRAAAGRVLVLRDVGAPMMPWRTKIDRLIGDLHELTVVEILYFDDDPMLVAASPGRRPRPLQTWVNHCGGLPLLLLSDGRFVARPEITPSYLREALEPWPVRVVLHPLDDRDLWPKELSRRDALLPTFPMNRAGYWALLRWLPSRANDARSRFQSDSEPLWPRDVFWMRALLSFLPEPSFELAELLRSELLPHAPDSVLLTLAPVLHPTPQSAREILEARAWLKEWFRSNPQYAQAYASFWQSYVPEPPIGTPAFQRYKRDRAIMALHLATGSAADAQLAELTKAFADSPVADDWYEELERIEHASGLSIDTTERVRRLRRTTRAQSGRHGSKKRPTSWSMPSPWVTLVAGLGAVALVPIGVGVAPRAGVASASSTTSAAGPPPPVCGVGAQRCNDLCTDFSTDPQNCGGCGAPCPAGMACQGGACSCRSPAVDCSGVCVDPGTDAVNCGVCGKRCAAGATCVGGQCTICKPGSGLTDCHGKCIDLDTSTANCGKCGSSCDLPYVERRCSAGVCTAPKCAYGYGNCDGQLSNGCEASILIDVENCGTCGHRCVSFPNGTARCQAGECIGLCAGSWANCDGSWKNGCETNLDDAASCGGCGKQCAAGQTCVSEVCTAPSVKPPSTPAPTIAAPDCASCERTFSTCDQLCSTSGRKGSQLPISSSNALGMSKDDAANAPSPSSPDRSCVSRCQAALTNCLTQCSTAPKAAAPKAAAPKAAAPKAAAPKAAAPKAAAPKAAD